MEVIWHFLGRAAFWGSWPLLWLYLRNTKRTRVIVTAGDKVLVVKVWLGAGQWILPGGGLHRDEDPLRAAAREVREETGIELDISQLKSAGTLQAKEYGFPFETLLYTAEMLKPVTLRNQKLEIIDARWIAKQDLADLSPLTAQLLSNWS